MPATREFDRAPVVRYDAAVLTAIPDVRVVARNTSIHSANKIHDDTVAQKLGFKGGLVPGVTIYAYMTRAIIAGLGPAWIERGSAAVRFTYPVYAGDVLTIQTTAAPVDQGTIEVRAVNPGGTTCAILQARLAAPEAPPVDIGSYPRAALPAERLPATRATLEAIGVLGSPERLYDAAAVAEYAEKFRDPNPLYLGADATVHPALYIEQGNRAVDRNVLPGPWMHVSSEVQHLGRARVGDHLTTRGRVHRLFEKKGNEFVEVDLLVVANDTQAVAQLRHTAIYQLAALR
jgi:acyl dehydratase